MSVQERKRKTGITYYVTNTWNGKPVWERSGTNKRQAEIDDRAMRKSIEKGTYVPKSGLKRLTVAGECDLLSKALTGPSAEIYTSRLRLHVLSRSWLAEMVASEVRSEHVQQLVEELRSERKPDGSRRLSDQTIANVLEVIRLVFAKAVKAKRLTDQPVDLSEAKLVDSDVEREPYTRAEAALLTRHTSIRLPTRVLNALALYTGAREGEVCGLRWSDVDVDAPLHCLHIRRQYEGRPLKTKLPRRVPVHPDLAAILNGWATLGFELHVGRKPQPEDPIVPCVHRGELRSYTKHGYYQAFIRGCRVAGVTPKTLHSTRHTFISLCRRANCNDARLAEITHGKSLKRKRKTIDRYTHRDWLELCEVVLLIDFDAIDAHQDTHLDGKKPLFLTGRIQEQMRELSPNSPKTQPDAGCPASGQTTPFEHQNCCLKNTRQESRQDITAYRSELFDTNERRRQKLLDLRRVDPTAAEPDLFLTAALSYAYSDDRPGIERNLASAVMAIGGSP